MPEQALTMAKNISERGGDVATAFSKLGKETVDNLKTIAGNDLSNTNVLKALEKAYKSAEGSELKTAFGAITRALTPSDNALVKSAQTLKAIPNLASMILATAFLGWGIPAFNIYFTRNKLKKNEQDIETLIQDVIYVREKDENDEEYYGTIHLACFKFVNISDKSMMILRNYIQ